jgi:hypothetical protein
VTFHCCYISTTGIHVARRRAAAFRATLLRMDTHGAPLFGPVYMRSGQVSGSCTARRSRSIVNEVRSSVNAQVLGSGGMLPNKHLHAHASESMPSYSSACKFHYEA